MYYLPTVGPVIGGVMYEFLGYKSPFLLIAGLAVVDGVLRLLQQRPAEEESKEKADDYSSLNLLKDPYVLLAAAFLFVGTAASVMVGGMVPVWMMMSMNASAWQQGVSALPAAGGFIIGTFLSSMLVGRTGRWLLILVGILGLGVSMAIIPLARNIPELITPYLAFGIFSGLAETTVLTEIGELADTRHGSKYGSAFAISESAMCIGITIGLAVSGVLMDALGFFWMMLGLGLLNVLLSPAAILLRNVPSTEKMDKLTIVYKEENQLKTQFYKPQPGED
ncbi:chromaffin granule amine transporter-like isoform X1 [Branchiostoma floridae]|uniref:Chromaffin granule amine transporter-like isoform X1 n=1 Tax=Branchiostoma floridae TaxID=7739 RepID=A0A9J7LBI7_BRAFL|nr:chromaffin granule amine transporter-like isoform X1 [Branchiostoma floridae]